MSQEVLVVEGLGRRYGGRWVLRDVGFALARGEFVALVGESGSGKSTLLNLIAGLDLPDAGRITVDGTPVDASNEAAVAALRSRKLGFVFQAFHLLPHLSVVQNVALPLLLTGIEHRSALESAARALRALGLAERADERPGVLSGGEQQRVALARAVVHQPRLVLADEPTGNLDPATADTALALLRAQCGDGDRAVLMVTHSEHAAAAADRVLRLDAAGLHVPNASAP